MNNEINEVMRQYAEGEISREEANAELARLEAGFHLEDGNGPGWTDAEMEEGFTPGEAAKPVQRGPDHSRRIDLAGQTVIQETASGRWAVSYNDHGYATKAVRED